MERTEARRRAIAVKTSSPNIAALFPRCTTRYEAKRSRFEPSNHFRNNFSFLSPTVTFGSILRENNER